MRLFVIMHFHAAHDETPPGRPAAAIFFMAAAGKGPCHDWQNAHVLAAISAVSIE